MAARAELLSGFAVGVCAGDGAALGSVEGDDDGVTGAALACCELAAAIVPAVCVVVHDGSVAATTLPVPSTRTPPASATATSFGLI